MKRFLKTGVVLCLLCCFLTTTAFAGNEKYSKYALKNTGYNWNGTGSYNTKTAENKNWFMQVNYVGFGGASLNGTLGMAHAPCIGTSQRGAIHWASTPSSTWVYTGWLSDCGATVTYQLGVRVDSEMLLGNAQYAATSGYWNAN